MSNWLELISNCFSTNSTLVDLESHAKCPICYDYYTNVVSLPCYHSFCSLCIRRSLYFHPVCPLCHAPSTTGELRANFQLNTITTKIRELKQTLTDEMIKLVKGEVKQRREKWKRKRKISLNDEAEKDAIISSDEDEDEDDIKMNDSAKEHPTTHTSSSSSSSSSTSSSSSSFPSSSSTSSISIASVSSFDKVTCPICDLRIVAARINRHLDECLGKEENRTKPNESGTANKSTANLSSAIASSSFTSSAASSSSSSSSRLPFPVYNMLSDKSLKKLLLQVGFPSNSSLPSDRDSLIRRHREFILRHNAETDAHDRKPLTQANIIKEIIRAEKMITSNHLSKNTKQSLILEKFTTNANVSHPDTLIPSSVSFSSPSISGSGPGSVPLSVMRSSTPPVAARKRSRESSNAIDDEFSTSSPPKRRTQSPKSTIHPNDPQFVDHHDAEDLTVEDDGHMAIQTDDKPNKSEQRLPTNEHQASNQQQKLASSTAGAVALPSAPSASPSALPPHPPSSSSSSSSSPDLFAQLIAQYESIHGPRKRWRRRWGVDLELYKGNPPPITQEKPNPNNTNNSINIALTSKIESAIDIASVDDGGDVILDKERTIRSQRKHSKQVFALFHSKHEASIMTPSIGASSSAPGSSSSSSSSPSPSTSSSSGAIRVPTAVCSQCQTLCRGSFPLGASIVCPRCRTGRQSVGGDTQMRGGSKSTSTSVPSWSYAVAARSTPSTSKHNWMIIAQAQLANIDHPPNEDTTIHSTFSIPSFSSSSLVSSSSSSSSSASSSSSSSSLTLEQKQLIESRRIAALEKLKAARIGQTPTGEENQNNSREEKEEERQQRQDEDSGRIELDHHQDEIVESNCANHVSTL